MRATAYVRAFTTLRLEQHEEVMCNDDKGYPFYVREMHFSEGDDRVTLTGPAKTKDGRRGYVNRSAAVLLSTLREDHRLAILNAHTTALTELVASETAAGRMIQ